MTKGKELTAPQKRRQQKQLVEQSIRMTLPSITSTIPTSVGFNCANGRVGSYQTRYRHPRPGHGHLPTSPPIPDITKFRNIGKRIAINGYSENYLRFKPGNLLLCGQHRGKCPQRHRIDSTENTGDRLSLQGSICATGERV